MKKKHILFLKSYGLKPDNFNFLYETPWDWVFRHRRTGIKVNLIR